MRHNNTKWGDTGLDGKLVGPIDATCFIPILLLPIPPHSWIKAIILLSSILVLVVLAFLRIPPKMLFHKVRMLLAGKKHPVDSGFSAKAKTAFRYHSPSDYKDF